MRIGVDVGGTNTDAVLLSDRTVLAAVKRPTSQDVSGGIVAAVRRLIEEARISPAAIDAVMIGTTHFTNAFIQRRELASVFVLRIGYPASRGIPPFSGWPADIRAAVEGGMALVSGGYEFDGRPIAPFDETAVRDAARQAMQLGIRQVAVSCIFSQLNAEQEQRAAEIIRQEAPEISVSLSSEVGRVGLLERENAAIMNASLRPLAGRVVDAFGTALASLGISAPYFVSQNDGTLMSAEHLRRYPVLTFAAGPTNSLRGAAWLTGTRNALVADIGGTTTDIGVLINGFPRQSSVHVDVGGVRTNFRMPDILSIGLGGGSLVIDDGSDATGRVRVGPQSLGFRLLEQGRIFGGDVLTASDIAVALGKAAFGDPSRVAGLPAALVAAANAEMHRLVETGLDRMKTSAEPIPLILVGGGAILISDPLGGVSEVLTPAHAGVANAIGAAIGQVSGEIDRIYNIAEGGRAAAIEDAERRARAIAVDAGAAPDSIEISEIDAVPLQYLPGGATRIFCRAIGDLQLARSE